MDKASIMMYPFPATWTTNGVSTPMNSKLSERDKKVIRAVY
jgi:hypothetical protein